MAACALGLAAAAVAVAGVGGGTVATAELTSTSYGPTTTITGHQLEPASRREAALAAHATPSTASANGKPAKPGRVEVKYYIGVDFQTVAPGGAQLFEIRCPTRGEQPFTGGMFAPQPGLVTVNSSRMNPQPGFPTRPRAWYQGVANITGAALGWKPFVTCGRLR